jgi:thymidylate synthase
MNFLNRDVVTSDQFPEVYYDLANRIMYDGVEERNERTGKVIRAYPTGGYSFTINLESGFLPMTDRRRLFPSTAAAETAWYVQATQEPDFMFKYAEVTWKKFLEPAYDPPTEEGQGVGWSLTVPLIIKAAYGYRWRKHFNRDQLKLGIEALRANPSDRRVYISAWDPALDGLGAKGQLNVPCPVGFTLSVLNGRLNSTYMLRSSDVFVGLPYDVMGHALLMDMVAASLGIDLGYMTFTLAHPHIYDVHFDMVNHFLGQATAMDQLMKMPAWTIEKVEMFPHEYVAHVKEKAALLTWPLYCPRPEVVA